MSLEKVNYPHPHVDPRQPLDASVLTVNPPVFVCQAEEAAEDLAYELVVARDRAMEYPVLEEHTLSEPVFLPERALEPGEYFWYYGRVGRRSAVHSFRVSEDAVVVEVSNAKDWLRSFSVEHPRFLFPRRPDADFLKEIEATDDKSLKVLFESAERLLKESHHMDEPPYKGSREQDYERYRKIQYEVMWGSRKFVNGAQTMALAYALGGEKAFGMAAAARIVSIAKWDPHGSTHLAANDEPHMAVMWYGAAAADWAWDCFTEEELKAVVAHMRERAAVTFEHMHDLGQYGVERFDSHAGREIVFLANLLLVFHDHIPESEKWLDWLRPVLCGVWPIWANDDGSWAEGISYSAAYVNVMSLFASALKRRTGIDLYRKPFWRNHARWRMSCMPHYAEWIGFGDHSERWPSSWRTYSRIIELISREVGSGEFDAYVARLRDEADQMPPAPAERELVSLDPALLLCPKQEPSVNGEAVGEASVLSVYDGAGWAAFRTDKDNAEDDVALIFRSSPYGSVSHSHANNNDFILHAGGVALAMPSGYYAGYASPHHAHWVWHTQSHNCPTLSGAPQLLRSPKSRGEILSPYEDEEIAYVLGNADESYADRALRCRRHVVFFKKEKTFLLMDDFMPLEDIVSSFQWNLHSMAPFEFDAAERSFQLSRKQCALKGHVLYHRDGFFSASEGWDPPFKLGIQNSDQWVDQYHLRFTPTALVSDQMHGISELRLGVLLVPETPKHQSKKVESCLENGVEVARFAGNKVEIRAVGSCSDGEGLARVTVGERVYRLERSGIVVV